MTLNNILNPAIQEADDGLVNQEPLLVNTAGSLRYRPEVETALDNVVWGFEKPVD